jgi:hypothetical protein
MVSKGDQHFELARLDLRHKVADQGHSRVDLSAEQILKYLPAIGNDVELDAGKILQRIAQAHQ